MKEDAGVRLRHKLLPSTFFVYRVVGKELLQLGRQVGEGFEVVVAKKDCLRKGLRWRCRLVAITCISKISRKLLGSVESQMHQ